MTTRKLNTLRNSANEAQDSFQSILNNDTVRVAQATSHIIPSRPSKSSVAYRSNKKRSSMATTKNHASSNEDDRSDSDFQPAPRVNKRARQSSKRNSEKHRTRDSPTSIPPLLIGSEQSINELSSSKANSAKSKADVEEKHKLFDDLSRQWSELEAADEPEAGGSRSPRYACPYCNEAFPREKMTDKLKRALKVVKLKDDAYAEQEIKNLMKRVAGKHQKLLQKQMKVKRPVDSLEQHFFCRLHRAELVVRKEGRAKKYPEHINFHDIKNRLNRFRCELEKVIRQEKKSRFRDIALKAYEDLGKNKARSTMGVMSRVDNIMTGYYGSKGSAVIQDALSTMFLHTGALTNSLTAPQLPLEYLQQVLVPEAALLLIRQDLYNADANGKARARFPSSKQLAAYTEKAEEVLKDSTEFGKMVHMAENEVIADFSDQSLEKISLSSDESSTGNDSGDSPDNE